MHHLRHIHLRYLSCSLSTLNGQTCDRPFTKLQDQSPQSVRGLSTLIISSKHSYLGLQNVAVCFAKDPFPLPGRSGRPLDDLPDLRSDCSGLIAEKLTHCERLEQLLPLGVDSFRVKALQPCTHHLRSKPGISYGHVPNGGLRQKSIQARASERLEKTRSPFCSGLK